MPYSHVRSRGLGKGANDQAGAADEHGHGRRIAKDEEGDLALPYLPQIAKASAVSHILLRRWLHPGAHGFGDVIDLRVGELRIHRK